jgi:hypothetical protein
LRQPGDELMRELPDGIEEAQPQVLPAHMHQKVMNQGLVIRLDGPDEYPPAFPQHEMPLPLRRIRANGAGQFSTSVGANS